MDADAEEMITWQGDFPARLWAEWKREADMDRDTSLEDRMRMLIEADRDGRVDFNDV